MAWATLADVLAVTGLGAETVDLAAGSAVVTIYANRTEAASGGIHARDLEWLRQATCWQTVWQKNQPGFEARSVVSSYSQDGLTVAHAAEWNISLAPMAARALKNLSWKGSRTLKVEDVRIPAGLANSRDFTNERSDYLFSDWENPK